LPCGKLQFTCGKLSVICGKAVECLGKILSKDKNCKPRKKSKNDESFPGIPYDPRVLGLDKQIKWVKLKNKNF
jgi:hypothetical protein